MRKHYRKSYVGPVKTAKERKRPTYEERVKRIYPSARIYNEGGATDEFTVYAMNGTDNVLAVSTLNELDAWQRAAAAVQPPDKPTQR